MKQLHKLLLFSLVLSTNALFSMLSKTSSLMRPIPPITTYSSLVVRPVSTKAIVPVQPKSNALMISSLLGSKRKIGINTPIDFFYKGFEIPRIKFQQYKEATKEAAEYIGQKFSGLKNKVPHFKTNAEFVSKQEAKEFFDLELVKILKNKTINSTTFWSNMMALAGLLGFYKMTDFINNIYENNTILMWAIEADNQEIVQLLLNAGADIHKQNSDGDTAMIIAAQYGNSDMVELLISFIHEKYKNDPEMLEQELEKLVRTKNNEGKTALLEVVDKGNFLGSERLDDPTEKGRINIIKLLLENGAEVKAQDNQGDNVLFLLAYKIGTVSNNKDTEYLREIFDILSKEEPGALQAVNHKGNNLLLEAVGYETTYLFNYLKEEVVDIMHQDNEGENIIFKALKVRESFIDKKTKKTIIGVYGRKNDAMLKAVFDLIEERFGKEGSHNKLKEFLQIKDKRGFTVLQEALQLNSSFSNLELLVQKGVKVSNVELEFVVRKSDIKAVKLFLENSNVSPTFKDLGIAFKANNIDIFKLLLNSKNIDKNIKNEFIDKSLPMTIQNQNSEFFTLLFPLASLVTKNNALINIVNSNDSSMINAALDSDAVSDDMKREMLQEAVILGKAEETVNLLLSNAKTQKAYNDQYFRLQVLKEAIGGMKSNYVDSVLKNKKEITVADLYKDPVVSNLLKSWTPAKKEVSEGMFTSLWNRLFSSQTSSKGPQTSKEFESQYQKDKELFDKDKELFDQELHKMVIQENNKRRRLAN